MDAIILQLFNGLSLSSILLMVSLGLVFAFGLMGVINMAHGEFIMVGAYVTYVFQQTLAASLGGLCWPSRLPFCLPQPWARSWRSLWCVASMAGHWIRFWRPGVWL